MPEMKLPKLPDRTLVKITINVSPDLQSALGGYARFYEETYGQAEPVAELIPAMLTAFLESDRAFVAARKAGRADGSR